MILENLEKKGGNAMTVKIDKVVHVLRAGERIRVPDDFDYDNKKFKKITKVKKTKKYKIISKGNQKIRGSLIPTNE